MLNFTVTNQKIIFSGIAVDEIGDPLVSGSANLYLCHFDFNETWRGFTKTAVFEQTDCKNDGIKYSPILDENDNCYIPKDIIKDNGHIRVGIYGVKDEVRMPTVYSSSFLVRVGAVPDGYIPSEEKSLYEQLLEKYNQAFLLIEDLAGGTAGQVLVKESDDDYDFTWHDFSADAPIQNISVNGTVQPIVDKTVNLEVVEPEDGKGLSTNDYTNADKTKLEGIEAGAQANVQSDWQQTDTTKDDYIKNKPSIVETEEFEQFQQTVEGKFDEVDDELELKADKSTTYTKTEVDEKLDDKADADTVYTKSQADALLDEKVDKVTGKGLSTNDYDNTEKEKVSEAYSLRHSHANKALLDTYDQSNADIADAVAKKHTHANKSILDTISQTLINTWNTVTGKYEKPTDGIPKSDMTTSVQTSLDNADSALQPDDVQDNVTSVYTDKPLSAKQGKLLNDRLNNVEARGRFLSLWDCVTGKPTTDPETLPYNYKTGDWYRVSNVTASTLYRPSGSSYTGTASTVVETEDVNVGDCYWYDGSSWSLEVNHTSPDAVQDVKVDGTSVVSDGVANIDLNGKVDKVAGKGLSTNDFTNEEKQKVDNALQPSALNNYRTSAEQDVIDNTKVDKVTGKGLSANDYSDTEKQKVADAYADRHTHSNKSILDGITQALINTWNTVTGKYEKPSSGIPKSDMASAVQTSLEKADSALQSSALNPYRTATAQDVIDNGKVDKVTGKGLSTNDFDNAEKAKVDSALQPTDVKDNLTSTDTNKPLSAKQGKVLNDTLTSQSEAIVALGANKQDKSDSNLTTTDKTIVGAINEVSANKVNQTSDANKIYGTDWSGRQIQLEASYTPTVGNIVKWDTDGTINVRDPIGNDDAVNRGWVNSNKLDLSGGNLTGALTINNLNVPAISDAPITDSFGTSLPFKALRGGNITSAGVIDCNTIPAGCYFVSSNSAHLPVPQWGYLICFSAENGSYKMQFFATDYISSSGDIGRTLYFRKFRSANPDESAWCYLTFNTI